jgi:molybdopterin converting factor small subunit
VPRLRLFAGARDAAGTARADVPGATVAAVVAEAVVRFGDDFAAVVEHSRIWCNGEPAEPGQPVGEDDEVAVLPPVSGGADPEAGPRTRR